MTRGLLLLATRLIFGGKVPSTNPHLRDAALASLSGETQKLTRGGLDVTAFRV